MEGVLNHPWFHPTVWGDMVAGRWPDDDDTRIYAFFDYEMVSIGRCVLVLFVACGDLAQTTFAVLIDSRAQKKIIPLMVRALEGTQMMSAIVLPIGKDVILRIRIGP
jgi:hypothetical protein